jgi:hypothetical protein
MNKNQKQYAWNITGKRFVAFFDILGFKDRVMRESHEKIYKDLAGIQVNEKKLEKVLENQAVKNIFNNSEIYVVKFSDSVVLFSKNDTIDNFILFLISARFLFYSFLKRNFLVKGGMAYGEISLDKENQLYFGQPIIDAFLLEEEVNYIGVVAHNSIDMFKQCIKANHKFYPLLTQLIFEGKSPLKSGLITHYNLDWFLLLIDKNNRGGKTETILKTEIITDLKNYYLGVSGSPRRYIDNTIEFIDKNSINLDKSILLPS